MKSCPPCIKAKMRAASTTAHTKPKTVDKGESYAPFEFISTDVCGPFNPSSVCHGHRFLVGFRDKYSSHTTVIPVKGSAMCTGPRRNT